MSGLADFAPVEPTMTAYDQTHAKTYLRMLDADADGAAWEEVARLVLSIDPAAEPGRARRCFNTHLERARWMSANGYLEVLKSGSR